MNYQIITAETPELLAEKINRWINLGWITQGGAVYVSKGRFFMQTIIVGMTVDPDFEGELSADEPIESDEDIKPLVPPEQRKHIDPYTNEEYFEQVIRDELSSSSYIAIKRGKIVNVAELLHVVTLDAFKQYPSNKVKDEILSLIKNHHW